MPLPTDPLFSQQWHFSLLTASALGDTTLVQRIWDEYSGAGVHIGVYDNGIEYTHSDLNDNYDPSLHVTVGGSVQDGAVVGNDGHGTCVAGIIGAELNGSGSVGIAWGSSLTSVNVFGPGFGEVIGQMASFDVTNNSWTVGRNFENFNSLAGSLSDVNASYKLTADTGRGGLGTIIVQSAGNDDLNANGAGLNASRYTVTVGALLETGFAASYSNFGACLLVSAAGGDTFVDISGNNLDTVDGTRLITTTDQVGGNGFNDIQPDVNLGNAGTYTFVNSDFTDNMKGTSAAAPMVTGVVALMLEANSSLGWRDVHDILAMTAFNTGSALAGPSGLNENNTWFINHADTWNGGGMHFSEDYGYGAVNLFAAVRMAEAYKIINAPARTSANELTASTGTVNVNTAIPDLSSQTFNFTISSNIQVNQVYVTIDVTHAFPGNLDMFLVSPEGTEVQLTYGSQISDGPAVAWTFGVEAMRGELAAGTWQLRVADVVEFNSGSLDTVKIEVFGDALPGANDVYVYTDEFQLMRDLDPSRGTLSDGDGGTDWINAAVLTSGAIINLLSGSSSTIDGRTLTIAAGSIIENAMTGDGDDQLTGNASTNQLLGMRGSDTLNGGTGTDILKGGAGNDLYIVDAQGEAREGVNQGTDTVQSSVSYGLGANIENLILVGISNINGAGNSSANRLTGNSGNNTLTGGLGRDVLIGGTGTDILRGGLDDDLYIVDSAGEARESLNEGIDTVQSSVTYALGENIENLILTGTVNLNGSGNSSANRLTGNNGNNTLTGGLGQDVMIGGTGTDILRGGLDDDLYIVDNAGEARESLNEGTDTVRSSVTYALGDNIENLVLTGTGNINGTGNSIANTLTGNSGNNQFSAFGGGADTVIGGTGNDIYRVDTTDTIIELVGSGIDTVRTTQNYTLGAELENLTLEGTGNAIGTGNNLDNKIVGNSGNNTLIGGLGRDILTGGSGTDRFDFNAIAESGITGATRDVIVDFSSGGSTSTVDRIDLSTIDAISGGMDDAFTFLGAGGPFTAAGQVRAIQSGNNTLIQLNTDSDFAVEMVIQLNFVLASNINTGDFVL